MSLFNFWGKDNQKPRDDDDFSRLEDVDFDDFGFEAELPDDKRKPSTTFSSFKEGVVGEFKSTDIERIVKDALPKGYGDIISAKDQVKSAYTEVVRDALKEFEPYKQDLKKLAASTLDSSQKVLPETWFNKLKELTDQRRSDYNFSKKQDESALIQQELTSIFSAQTELDKQRQERQDKRDGLKSIIEHSRFRDSISQLDAIRKASIAQVNYNDNVQIKYQRKNLEASLKRTNLLFRLVEETSAFRQEAKSVLASINKNTGLPDYVKLKGSEMFMTSAKQRMYGRMLDYAFNGNNFLANFLREAKESAKGWVSGFVSAVGPAISDVQMAASMANDDTFGGPQMSKASMLGQGVGGFVGGEIKDKLFRQVNDIVTGKKKVNGKTFPWADQVNKGGAQAQLILNNLPYYLNKFADEHEFSRIPGVSGGIDVLREMTGNALKGRQLSVERYAYSSLTKPAIFSGRVSRSITDVIPGYLAKILQGITSIRTGQDAEEIKYDFTKGSFTGAAALTTSIMEKALPTKLNQTFRSDTKYIFDQIDPNNDLSNKDREAIMRVISTDIRKGRKRYDRDYLTSKDTFASLGADKAELAAKIFDQYLDNDEKLLRLRRQVGQIVPTTSNLLETIQQLMDTGYGDILLEQGIIKDNGVIDRDRLFDLITRSTDDDITSTPSRFDPNNPDYPNRNRGLGGELRHAFNRNVSFARNSWSNRNLRRTSLEGSTSSQQSVQVRGNNAYGSRGYSQSQITSPFRETSYPQSFNYSGAASRVASQSQQQAIQQTANQVASLRNEVRAISNYRRLALAQSSTQGQDTGLTRSLLNIRDDEQRSSLFASMFHGMLPSQLSTRAQMFGGKLGSLMKWGTIASLAPSLLPFMIGKKLYDRARQTPTEGAEGDVYIPGESSPRMLNAVMKHGGYFNTDGSPIRGLIDVKGTVLDDQGMVVIAEDELMSAKIIGPKGAISTFKAITKGALKKYWSMAKTSIGVSLYMLKSPFTTMKAVKEGVFGRASDVYVRGRSTPALLKQEMKAGHYFDADTGKSIDTVRDIDGTVVDLYGNIVLSNEDIDQGLFLPNGKSLKIRSRRSIRGRIRATRDRVSAVSNGIASTMGKVGSGVRYLRDRYNEIADRNTRGIEYVGARISRALPSPPDSSAILNNLNNLNNVINPLKERVLTGATGSRIKETSTRYLANVRGAGSNLLSRLRSLSEQDQSTLQTEAQVKSAETSVSMLDRLKSIATTLDERLPGRRRLGDSDGDGDVENSVADILQHRNQHGAANAVNVNANASHPEKKKQSLLSKLFGLLGGGLKGVIGTVLGGGLALLTKGIRKAVWWGMKKLTKGLWWSMKQVPKLLWKGLTDWGPKAFKGILNIGKRYIPKLFKGLLNYNKWGVTKVVKGLWETGKTLTKGIFQGVAKAGGSVLRGLGMGSGISGGASAVAQAGSRAASSAARITGGVTRAGGAALRVGGRFAGVAGVGIGAAIDAKDIYDGVVTGDTDKVVSGSMGLGGAGAGAAIGTLIFPGVGTLIGAGIGGLLGWGGGVGVNGIRHWVKKGKLSEMEHIRFVQYGFDPKQKEFIDPILTLEKIVEEALVEHNGQWIVDRDKIDGEEAYKLFGITEETTEERLSYIQTWLEERFIPVFQMNVQALKVYYPKKILAYLDEVKPEEKYNIIEALRTAPASMYQCNINPFDLSKLPMGPGDVANLLNQRSQELKETAVKSALDETDGFFSRPWFESDSEYAIRKQQERSQIEARLSQDNNKALSTITNTVAGASLSNISANVKEASFTPIKISTTTGEIKIDALTAIRLKCYGLTAVDDRNRVIQLMQLEQTFDQDPGITLKDDNTCIYRGDLSKILDMFINTGVNMNSRWSVSTYIQERFLPVYLKWRAILAQYQIRDAKNLHKAENLSVYAKLNIARNLLMATTDLKQSANETRGDSVFTMKTSPWKDYELNQYAFTTDDNIAYLRKQAKDQVQEEKVSNQEMDKKEATNNYDSFLNSVKNSSLTKSIMDFVYGNDKSGSDTALPPTSIARPGAYADSVSGMTSSMASVGGIGMAGMAQGIQQGINQGQMAQVSDVSYGGGQIPPVGSEVPSPAIKIRTGIPILDEALQAKLYRTGTRNGKPIYGSDNKLMNQFIAIESMGDASAVAPNGLYRGLGQMGRDAWSEANALLKGGVGGFENVMNPGINFAATKAYMAINARRVKNAPMDNPLHLYLAHQQGAGGLTQIYHAARTGSSVEGKIGKNMQSNLPRSAGSATPLNFYNYWAGAINSRYKAFADKGYAKFEKNGSGTTTDSDISSSLGSTSSLMAGIQQGMQGMDNASSASQSAAAPVSGDQSTTGNYSQMASNIGPNTDGYGLMKTTSYGDPSSSYSGNAILNPVNTGDDFVPANNGEDKNISSSVGKGSDKAVKAATYATSNAASNSRGRCAEYVRKALQAAGYKFTPLGSAYMYNDLLGTIGFTRVPNNGQYMIGDVIVYGRTGGHPHGHIQIYNGRNWVSDWVQRSIMPYRSGRGGAVTLWRDLSGGGQSSSANTDLSTDANTPNTQPVGPLKDGYVKADTYDGLTNNQVSPQDRAIQEYVRNADPMARRPDTSRVQEMQQIKQRDLHSEALVSMPNLMQEQITVSKDQLEILKQVLMVLQQTPPGTVTNPGMMQAAASPKETVVNPTSPLPKDQPAFAREYTPVNTVLNARKTVV